MRHFATVGHKCSAATLATLWHTNDVSVEENIPHMTPPPAGTADTRQNGFVLFTQSSAQLLAETRPLSDQQEYLPSARSHFRGSVSTKVFRLEV